LEYNILGLRIDIIKKENKMRQMDNVVKKFIVPLNRGPLIENPDAVFGESLNPAF
jgi:hypothetical protein